MVTRSERRVHTVGRTPRRSAPTRRDRTPADRRRRRPGRDDPDRRRWSTVTTAQRDAPAGRSAEASGEATMNSTSGSESTSMDTLYNLDDLLAGIRALSREVAVVVDRLDRIENKIDHLKGVTGQ
ncbi:hypothetical protein CVAR_2316 [Corynebacterium variabile DSM 44702]|uniref:Uncharacterized protein n=1 Tax=Corynebacterium variabile (strain DSM 44702 / CIP 107183 / JCM 12073 / NCIMB 30131) TaxID=858619 RepID=G0HGQ4_CORVD|nr:hypothetical protein CVAR_2316 [Corynebacterium variabile DSM 44702]